MTWRECQVFDVRLTDSQKKCNRPSSAHRLSIYTMQIIQFPRVLCMIGALALMSGCQEKLGGGTRSIATGATAKKCVYGIRSGKELGFVIFTDLSGEGTKSSAGSTWTGQIQPATGPAVQYEGDSDGLTINGTRYEFANGRVFLVTTTGSMVSEQQLSVPIGTARFDAEIDSIVKRKEIQNFLAQ